MELEIIISSEMIQEQKDKCFMISLICRILIESESGEKEVWGNLDQRVLAVRYANRFSGVFIVPHSNNSNNVPYLCQEAKRKDFEYFYHK
jgi:hypothetical protein